MYNMVYLIGKITGELETTKTETGKTIMNVNLAVQRNYPNEDGVYDTDIVKCVLLDNIAKRTSEFCKKGDIIALRGQVRTSNYVNDKDEKIYSTEIFADKISFLNSNYVKNVEKDKDVDIN